MLPGCGIYCAVKPYKIQLKSSKIKMINLKSEIMYVHQKKKYNNL